LEICHEHTQAFDRCHDPAGAFADVWDHPDDGD
jgi:hypothetical protein